MHLLLQGNAIQIEKRWSYLLEAVNKMFTELISETIEVYMDDMLIKSLKTKDRVKHVDATLYNWRRFRIILNPLKYASDAAFEKFIG